MNRIKALILSFIIIFVSLCVPVSSDAATTKPDISTPVKLSWNMIGNGQPQDTQAVMKVLNTYLKNKINATIDLKVLTWGDDFEQKSKAMLLSLEPLDITFTSNWALDYLNYASSGLFVDITDMLETYAPNAKKVLGPSVIKGASVNGRLYALPSNTNTTTQYGIVYNQKLATKYNINMSKVKNLKDLEPILKVIKSKEKSVTPFKPYGTGTVSNVLFSLPIERFAKLYNIPVSVLKSDNSLTAVNDISTPQAKNLFVLMNSWNRSGLISKNVNRYDSSDINTGKVFSFFDEVIPSKAYDLSKQTGITFNKIDIDSPYRTTESCLDTMQAISYTSENPERALMFLDLLYCDKYVNNLINFGIEKIHYTKKGANSISLTSKGQLDYYVSMPWMFGDQKLAYIADGYDPAASDTIAKYNTSSKNSPLLGFSYTKPPDLINTVSSVSYCYSTYIHGLICGSSDPQTTLPKFIKELQACGINKIINDVQRQIDSFKEENK